MKALLTIVILLSSLLCFAQTDDIPSGDMGHIRINDSVLDQEATTFKVHSMPDDFITQCYKALANSQEITLPVKIAFWVIVTCGLAVTAVILILIFVAIDQSFTSSIIVNKIVIQGTLYTPGHWFFVIERPSGICSIECSSDIYYNKKSGDLINICDEYGILSGRLTHSKVLTDEGGMS